MKPLEYLRNAAKYVVPLAAPLMIGACEKSHADVQNAVREAIDNVTASLCPFVELQIAEALKRDGFELDGNGNLSDGDFRVKINESKDGLLVSAEDANSGGLVVSKAVKCDPYDCCGDL